MFGKFKNLDIFSKTIDEFKIKTFSGGFISLISLTIIFVLTISEFLYYLEVQRTDMLYVDNSNTQKIPIYLNMTFPQISCDAVTIDIMDVSGEHQQDVQHFFFKQRLDLKGKPIAKPKKEDKIGTDEETDIKNVEKFELMKEKEKDPNYCGSCYTGDPTKCCATCDDVKAEYKKLGWQFVMDENIEQCWAEVHERKRNVALKEGCSLHGEFFVSKVAGNFHFAPGKSFHTISSHSHSYSRFEIENFNTSHFIHNLGFGKKYPGLTNPLDGTRKVVTEGSALYQYFIKVVPTIYEFKDGSRLETNQYACTQHFRPRTAEQQNVLPGVYFMYDLSPILVHIKEEKKSFIHFITQLCAIVGGVFTVSGLIDGLFFFFQNKKGPANLIK